MAVKGVLSRIYGRVRKTIYVNLSTNYTNEHENMEGRCGRHGVDLHGIPPGFCWGLLENHQGSCAAPSPAGVRNNRRFEMRWKGYVVAG